MLPEDTIQLPDTSCQPPLRLLECQTSGRARAIFKAVALGGHLSSALSWSWANFFYIFFFYSTHSVGMCPFLRWTLWKWNLHANKRAASPRFSLSGGSSSFSPKSLHQLITSAAYTFPLNGPPSTFSSLSLLYELTTSRLENRGWLTWAAGTSSTGSLQSHPCSISYIYLQGIYRAPWGLGAGDAGVGVGGLTGCPGRWWLMHEYISFITSPAASGPGNVTAIKDPVADVRKERWRLSADCRPSWGTWAAVWRFQHRRLFIP